jgi:hypothetical protein
VLSRNPRLSPRKQPLTQAAATTKNSVAKNEPATIHDKWNA